MRRLIEFKIKFLSIYLYFFLFFTIRSFSTNPSLPLVPCREVHATSLPFIHVLQLFAGLQKKQRSGLMCVHGPFFTLIINVLVSIFLILFSVGVERTRTTQGQQQQCRRMQMWTISESLLEQPRKVREGVLRAT